MSRKPRRIRLVCRPSRFLRAYAWHFRHVTGYRRWPEWTRLQTAVREDPRGLAGRGARRDRFLGRTRHVLRDRLDAREGRRALRLHGEPRAVRRAGHRGGARPRARLWRRGSCPRRLPRRARAARADRAPVRRLPHPDRRPPLFQHDAARPRRHRDTACPRDARARRRDLGRRLDLQGQRHRALLQIRPAREPRPAYLQTLAGQRVRLRARRPQGDERVARRPRACRTAPPSRRRTRRMRTCLVRPTRRRIWSCSRRT